MRASSLLLLALIGCTGQSGDDTGDTAGDQPGPGDFEYYIHTDAQPTGERSCYTPGDDWLTQTVDPARQVPEERTEKVEDFEQEHAVTEATVEIWADDVVDGGADLSLAADDNGLVTFTVDSCTPVAYQTSTPDELDETKDTYESHQIFEPVASAEAAPFVSVSKTTYLVILNLLGISDDPSLGTVAGTLYDCNGEPIEGAQVVVVDDSGDIPDGLEVKYFIDEFPARDQPHTSDDGLWTAVNIPPGEWTIEAWVSDGAGGHVLIGATALETFADSINVSNIYTGFGDGIRYPDACLEGAR